MSDKYRYIYGNKPGYYGYRLGSQKSGKATDPRLAVIPREIIEGKTVVDVGCNTGVFSILLAKTFNAASLLGIDIDDVLISRAIATLLNEQEVAKQDAIVQHTLSDDSMLVEPVTDDLVQETAKKYPELSRTRDYFPISFKIEYGPLPFDDVTRYMPRILQNIRFKTANIARDDFSAAYNSVDVVVCFSVTKWIHLNFGDEGVKRAFSVMYNLLKQGGVLLLEAQPWERYQKKKIFPCHRDTYQSISFRPDQFPSYLLSIGFSNETFLGVPESTPDVPQAFRAPIVMYRKTQEHTIDISPYEAPNADQPM